MQIMTSLGTDIKKAAGLLEEGWLVGMPTETVYGLAADASSKEALNRLFEAKGRPRNHPVIVHIASLDALANWAADIPPVAYVLASKFWPGPLTMIFKKKDHVLLEVTGGQDTVAVRIPRHEIALKLLEEFGGGIAAPSANRFGKLSPTSASDVVSEFGDRVAYILDGGTCEVGIESTIIDLSSGLAKILRPGMIGLEQLEHIEGLAASARGWQSQSTTRAPGTLKSHYSPTTPMRMVKGDRLQAVLSELNDRSLKAGVLSFSNGSPLESAWIVACDDPEEYARNLYSNLRRLDSFNCDWILVEEVPQTDGWSGIRDRLERASCREGDQAWQT